MDTRIYTYKYTDFYANYTGINNTKTVTGFLAAGDLLRNFPEVIEPIKFDLNNNVTEIYNGIEKIKLIPILWDALREVETVRRAESNAFKSIITQLTARIVALENRP
jgi:hypothetical protein